MPQRCTHPEHQPKVAPPPTPTLEEGPTTSNSEVAAEVASTETTTEETTLLDAAQAELSAGMTNPLARAGSAEPAVAGEQRREVNGVVISGSGVSPTAMDVAERTVLALVGNRDDVSERLAKAKTRVVIIPAAKKQTEVPEFAHLAGKKTFDGREWDTVRGSGGSLVGGEWLIAVPEENLVDLAAHPDAYGDGFSVALHEIAHTVHLKGVSKDERKELTDLYAARGGTGFTDSYAASNVEEYFAQSSSAFFNMNSLGGNGPEWVRSNDSAMYAFLVKLYGEPGAALDRAKPAPAPAPEASPGTPAPAAS